MHRVNSQCLPGLFCLLSSLREITTLSQFTRRLIICKSVPKHSGNEVHCLYKSSKNTVFFRFRFLSFSQCTYTTPMYLRVLNCSRRVEDPILSPPSTNIDSSADARCHKCAIKHVYNFGRVRSATVECSTRRPHWGSMGFLSRRVLGQQEEPA